MRERTNRLTENELLALSNCGDFFMRPADDRQSLLQALRPTE